MAVTLAQMVAAARADSHEISPADAARAVNEAELGLIVDVREPAEYEERHVPLAVNIPRGVLELRADPASPSARHARPRARRASAASNGQSAACQSTQAR